MVSRDASTTLTTILGSCIAVCLFDEGSAVGSMTHFLLPMDPPQDVQRDRRTMYAPVSIPKLRDLMIREGAHPHHIKAKIFGGGAVVKGLGKIGQQNATAARALLQAEKIPLIAEDVGGTCARRVRMIPCTGAVQLQRIPTACLSQPETENLEIPQPLFSWSQPLRG